MTMTHTMRRHHAHETLGTGLLYQGRFKSFPVDTDEHFLTVCRYVERNALRANLVERAEDWRWSGPSRHRHPGLHVHAEIAGGGKGSHRKFVHD